MRHGDAPSAFDLPDFERQLSPLGQLQASEAAEFLRTLSPSQPLIDFILCSPAPRTKSTYKAIENLFPSITYEFCDILYSTNEEAIFQLLTLQNNNINHLLVIGHNPVIYNLAIDLAKDHNPELLEGMPPARIISLKFDIENWLDLKFNNGEVASIFTPK